MSSVGGFRPDLGQYFRSRWEANYARYLTSIGSTFAYEPHRFTIMLPDGTRHCYTPDFLVDGKRYVEIKGWMRPELRQREIIEAAQASFLLPLILVREAEYRQIERDHAATIPTWEYDGDPRPLSPLRACRACGKKLTSRNINVALCSRQCAGAEKRIPKESRSCPVCGSEFGVGSWEPSRKYCSKRCKDLAQVGQPSNHARGSKVSDEARRRISEGKRRADAARRAALTESPV